MVTPRSVREPGVNPHAPTRYAPRVRIASCIRLDRAPQSGSSATTVPVGRRSPELAPHAGRPRAARGPGALIRLHTGGASLRHGSEIKSRELELLTDRVQTLGDRRDAFEAMRDLAAEGYRTETGDTWRPRNGSHSSQTGKLTSAAIDARDYLRARKDRETTAHLPEGTLVAFTGGKDFADVTAIWRSLDSIKIKYDDMVLPHGGGPGAEKIAASWAEKNGVHQVVCKPNWDRDGKAAPFRRNDVLLNFLPKGLLAFPGSGITNNLVDKARKIGIPVLLAAA